MTQLLSQNDIQLVRQIQRTDVRVMVISISTSLTFRFEERGITDESGSIHMFLRETSQKCGCATHFCGLSRPLMLHEQRDTLKAWLLYCILSSEQYPLELANLNEVQVMLLLDVLKHLSWHDELEPLKTLQLNKMPDEFPASIRFKVMETHNKIPNGIDRHVLCQIRARAEQQLNDGHWVFTTRVG